MLVEVYVVSNRLVCIKLKVKKKVRDTQSKDGDNSLYNKYDTRKTVVGTCIIIKRNRLS